METNIYRLFVINEETTLCTIHIKADSAETVRALAESAKFDYWCAVPPGHFSEAGRVFEVEEDTKYTPTFYDIDLKDLQEDGKTPREIRRILADEIIYHTIFD